MAIKPQKVLKSNKEDWAILTITSLWISEANYLKFINNYSTNNMFTPIILFRLICYLAGQFPNF